MRDYHLSLAADLACTAKVAFQQNRKVAHEPTSFSQALIYGLMGRTQVRKFDSQAAPPASRRYGNERQASPVSA
jgi:hypothetical protein